MRTPLVVTLFAISGQGLRWAGSLLGCIWGEEGGKR
jgi:hypothetical protein